MLNFESNIETSSIRNAAGDVFTFKIESIADDFVEGGFRFKATVFVSSLDCALYLGTSDTKEEAREDCENFALTSAG